MLSQKMSMFARGSALVSIFLLTLLMVALIQFMLCSSISQNKMVRQFQESVLLQKELDIALSKMEDELSENFHYPPSVKLRQFVPDTLVLGEREGCNFFELTLKKKNESNASLGLNAVYAARAQISASHTSEDDFSCFLLQDGNKIQVSVVKEGAKNKILFQVYETKEVLYEMAFYFSQSAEFSHLTAVDYYGKGEVNFIFFIDNEGHLFKVHVDQYLPFSFITIHSISAIQPIGKLVVGRHPEGKGMMLYCSGVEKTEKEYLLMAMEDRLEKDSVLRERFAIREKEMLSPVTLRQGNLICSVGREIKVWSAFDGTLRGKQKIKRFEAREKGGEVLLPPRVHTRKPIEKTRKIVTFFRDGIGLNEFHFNNEWLGRVDYSVHSD